MNGGLEGSIGYGLEIVWTSTDYRLQTGYRFW
jgi:hypothetical protein